MAKSAKPFWPAISTQAALPGFSGRAAWAEIAGQNGLADLATKDFYSVGYRGYKSCDIGKSEQFHFRLTGPSVTQNNTKLPFIKIFDFL